MALSILQVWLVVICSVLVIGPLAYFADMLGYRAKVEYFLSVGILKSTLDDPMLHRGETSTGIITAKPGNLKNVTIAFLGEIKLSPKNQTFSR